MNPLTHGTRDRGGDCNINSSLIPPFPLLCRSYDVEVPEEIPLIDPIE